MGRIYTNKMAPRAKHARIKGEKGVDLKIAFLVIFEQL